MKVKPSFVDEQMYNDVDEPKINDIRVMPDVKNEEDTVRSSKLQNTSKPTTTIITLMTTDITKSSNFQSYHLFKQLPLIKSQPKLRMKF